ncbi:hypothetical protein V475_21270 [Sphingobium baderi LL03]|uniref:Uncharacterized protein n=1 Tax=Sphingobium baderi LL03 TaxID=1114964 RepID=T0HRZ1_9SPHN|nr:hypothetical protein L485_08850 [Sphingobium baderi LL03]KMS55961.1 hypothetical protein V475_21270 [Sphingobium baderi LL03]
MREHVKQIEVLLGSSVKRLNRWTDMRRHIRFGGFAFDDRFSSSKQLDVGKLPFHDHQE